MVREIGAEAADRPAHSPDEQEPAHAVARTSGRDECADNGERDGTAAAEDRIGDAVVVGQRAPRRAGAGRDRDEDG